MHNFTVVILQHNDMHSKMRQSFLSSYKAHRNTFNWQLVVICISKVTVKLVTHTHFKKTLLFHYHILSAASFVSITS